MSITSPADEFYDGFKNGYVQARFWIVYFDSGDPIVTTLRATEKAAKSAARRLLGGPNWERCKWSSLKKQKNLHCRPVELRALPHPHGEVP